MSIQTSRLRFFLLTVLTVGTLQAEEGSLSQQVLMAKPLILTDNQIIVRVIRVEFPPGFKTPKHIHEGPGPRYVLAGKIKIADKDGVRVYSAGEVFWETGEPMVAENAADTPAVLLIFEVAPQKALTQGRVVIKPKEE